ncbi:hypothetical protein GGX14DRAFT_407410 [Mycena pura]|uniref:Uncharacterized protein n=1 Tax=Mycena pura TaxID=153505 RepID=A0AAD6UNA4_9AGAR|nr:hypothetical protein GGX14DRAFT_407410 [Mycena pura]
MSEQNQAEVKRGPGSHDAHVLVPTTGINCASRFMEIRSKDGEEFVFATYKMAVAVDRAAVAVAVATVNYETAKARREPRSVRVRLLLARLTAVEEAIKAFRAFNIALGPPEDSTEQHDIIANCGT